MGTEKVESFKCKIHRSCLLDCYFDDKFYDKFIKMPSVSIQYKCNMLKPQGQGLEVAK